MNNIFGTRQSDPKILRLDEIARTQKDMPGPQLDLARAYLNHFQTPPNWKQEDANKALNAFRRATSIARKHAPEQVESIQESAFRSLSEIAVAYHTYYSEQPDIKWLEDAIWLLENVLKDSTGQVERISETQEHLCSCWWEIAAWHEAKLNDESEDVERLKLMVAAGEKAISYSDDPEERATLDSGLAISQLIIGRRYLDKTEKSTVFGTPGGELLKINDREHKGYAQQAIRLLDQGRRRLHKYPNTENYTEMMGEANSSLARTYRQLYQLTWAHSKASQSIGILQKAVRAVPQEVLSWRFLAKAYEFLRDEYEHESIKGLNQGIDISNSLFGGVTGGGCTMAIAKLPMTLKLKSLENKANECYSMERKLMASPSDSVTIPESNAVNFDTGEWLDYAKTALSKVSVLTCLPLIALIGYIANRAMAIRQVSDQSPLLGLPMQLLLGLVFYTLVVSVKELSWKPLMIIAGANVIAGLIGRMGFYAYYGGVFGPLQILIVDFSGFLVLVFATKQLFKDQLEQMDFKKAGFFALAAAGLHLVIALIPFILNSRLFTNSNLVDSFVWPTLETALSAFLACLLVPWLRERISRW